LSSFAAAQEDLSAPLTAPGKEMLLFQEIPSVYGASKYQQKVTEAPSSVTIVTSDEIRKYGYRSLGDILRSVNGFYVTGDRNYSFLGVRGFNRPGDYNSRVLLLVDGHRLNDNMYDQAAIGADAPLDVDLIDRVEIIRGPSSSIYGANAFFGVINVLTKRGRDIKGVEVSTEAGSYDSYKGRFTYGDRFQNGLEFLISGSFFDSAGHDRLFYKEFNEPVTNNGIARDVDGERYYHLFTRSSLTDVTFQGGYTYRSKHIPTGSFGVVFNSRRNKTYDERGYVDLNYEHEFAQQLSLNARLHYDRFYYHGDYLFDVSEDDIPSFVLNKEAVIGEWWGTEMQLSKRLWEQHKLTIGGEYRDNFQQSQRSHDIDPFFPYLKDSRSSRVWAFYLQDEYALRENLILNVGVRHDHYDSFGGTTNPRLALIYNLKNTNIKLLYGEAFRAPNMWEMFYDVPSFGLAGNPRLRPETIKTYEVVVERSVGNRFRVAASGYYYTIDDLISQTFDPDLERLKFDNIDSIEAKGVELDVEGKWRSLFEGRLSYAAQETTDGKTGKLLTNSPRHMVKFNLIATLLRDRLFAGLEVRYLSARRTLSGKHASDFFVTNLTVFSQNLLNRVEFSGSIRNFFDERYGDPGSGEHRQDIIEQDGRTFWLKLKYAF
jgi:iron complex outermembrane receptor protein